MRIGAQPVNSASIIAGLTGATGLPTLSLASASQLNWNSDTILTRDGAANTLRQANGSSPQVFNIYNTRTDASNYERGVIRFSGNVFDILTQAAGTGTSRELRIGLSTFLQFENSGAAVLQRGGSSATTIFNVTTTGGWTSTAIDFARITPTINQASGVYNVLTIEPTETAIGAGPHYLLRGRVGGSNVFTVDRAGIIAIGNTVNAVSPTSPNRTVTISIGGTTYYLHAKTTND